MHPPLESCKKVLYGLIGNPQTKREYLMQSSPLFLAHKIKIPVLLAYGASEDRINITEVIEFVKKIKRNKIPYKFLFFPKEGYRFVHENNTIKFYKSAERFLEKYAGNSRYWGKPYQYISEYMS